MQTGAEICFKTIYLGDIDEPASPAFPQYLQLFFTPAQSHLNRVGMKRGCISDRLKRILKAFFCSYIKGILDSLVICFIIQQPGNDCPVASMPLVCPGKRIIKYDLGILRPSAEKFQGCTRYSHNAGGVRTGRTYHDRPYHVKNTAFFCHLVSIRNLSMKRCKSYKI